MNIKALVIHKLEKKQSGKAIPKKAQKELVITGVHERFMDEVKNVYYKKSNPVFGIFDNAKDSYPFQKFLQSYLDHEISFLSFTDKAITHFETVINETPQATGGYVLFCHYDTTDDFVSTIMLNDKESYIITENLDINANFRLDIEKLDVANFTNCSRLLNNEDIYLSFTRGKKDISNYFKKFIGCTDYTSSKEASENLKKALENYFIQSGFTKQDAEKTKASIFAYCQEKMKNKEDISLDFVSSLVSHEEPQGFKEFASAEEYQVSSSFKGHKTLKSLKYYTYRSKDLSIEFDGSLLGNRVVYNPKENSLLIKQVPDDLKSQITKTVSESEQNEE